MSCREQNLDDSLLVLNLINKLIRNIVKILEHHDLF